MLGKRNLPAMSGDKTIRYAFRGKPLEETIQNMREMLDIDRKKVFVVNKAKLIVSACDSHDTNCEIQRIFNFVKNGVRYVRDPIDQEWVVFPSKMLQRILITTIYKNKLDEVNGDRSKVQLTDSDLSASGFNPENKKDQDMVIESIGLNQGDCDDHSILLVALLLSVGIGARWKVIAQDKRDDYHHIYTEAYNNKKNKWVALDAIHENFKVGQEMPHEKSKIFEVGTVEDYM